MQLSVKAHNGCEAAVHNTRQWFHRFRAEPSGVAVTADISNAFNSTVPQFSELPGRTFPLLQLDICFKFDSALFTGARSSASGSIVSARGVQQETRCTERDHPGGIDFQLFFLDDGLIAGLRPLDKSEVVLLCTASQNFGPSDFPVCLWNDSASFKILGAAIGPSFWCSPSQTGC